MKADRLRASLPVGSLGLPLEYAPRMRSTNERAQELARQGAPHGTLVVADEQTAGRGRAGQRWLTPPRSAIAMSLLLRPESLSEAGAGALAVVGALAVAEALENRGVRAWVKWPNDVILPEGKVAGVLVETEWLGEHLEHAILGIGINVRPRSVPRENLDFPATCVEQSVGGRVDRIDLLLAVLGRLEAWLGQLGSRDLMRAWEARLAYLGQHVTVFGPGVEMTGRLAGVTPKGQLRLALPSGETLTVGAGGLSLRPIDTSGKWATLSTAAPEGRGKASGRTRR